MELTAIIPTAGERPQMLARAVASVRAQTRPADEILVVVDGDGPTRDEVARALDGVGVLGGGGRRGVSAARNLGGAGARGRLLAFLDDDDVWKPGYLAAVLADDDGFDVALTAFEKHNANGAAPEKVPPELLSEADFRVRNPGLRGSNLVIRRELYLAMDGFDESLPAFNDLDFGIRLSRVRPRYRRVVIPLVEFHSHAGPRLSSAGCAANREGMRRFLALHRREMSDGEYLAFVARARQLWGAELAVAVESPGGHRP